MFAAIILSLFTHVGFAGNDLSGAIGARKLTSARMTLYVWLAGCVFAAAGSVFLFRRSLSLEPLLVNTATAAVAAVAYPLFLYALEKGNATINGVIAGTFPIWTVILSLIFFDETLELNQVIAIITIFVGMILSALHLTRKTRLHNLFNRYSAISMVVSILWGISFTFVRIPVEQYGWFEANVVSQLVATALSIIILVPIIKRSKPLKFRAKQLKWPTINAAFGFSSSLAYNAAISVGASSIIAPIAGSYPGLYAVASYFIFKESLTKIQIAGVVLTVGGVVLLSIVSI